MDKPVAAIERMRARHLTGCAWESHQEDYRAILAYLDSIPDGAVPVVWPKELTRERLAELAGDGTAYVLRADSLRALAAIAPVRKKRVVDLWEHRCGDIYAQDAGWHPKPHDVMEWKGCRKRNVELED